MTRPRSDLLHMTFTRITVDAERMGGLPCVRGLREQEANASVHGSTKDAQPAPPCEHTAGIQVNPERHPL